MNKYKSNKSVTLDCFYAYMYINVSRAVMCCCEFTKLCFFLSSDFLHDLSLGQNVQDFWHRVHSIPASCHALSDESCVNQA